MVHHRVAEVDQVGFVEGVGQLAVAHARERLRRRAALLVGGVVGEERVQVVGGLAGAARGDQVVDARAQLGDRVLGVGRVAVGRVGQIDEVGALESVEVLVVPVGEFTQDAAPRLARSALGVEAVEQLARVPEVAPGRAPGQRGPGRELGRAGVDRGQRGALGRGRRPPATARAASDRAAGRAPRGGHLLGRAVRGDDRHAGHRVVAVVALDLLHAPSDHARVGADVGRAPALDEGHRLGDDVDVDVLQPGLVVGVALVDDDERIAHVAAIVGHAHGDAQAPVGEQPGPHTCSTLRIQATNGASKSLAAALGSDRTSRTPSANSSWRPANESGPSWRR